MVVAEIPLWITHGNEAGRDNTNATNQQQPSSSSSSSSSLNNTKRSAIASLGLWRKDRAAIYAVHMHPLQPSIVVTGGGDGTVRLWSTSTLFAQQHLGGRFVEQEQQQKQQGEQGTTTTTKAGYVSTGSSASDGGAGSSDDDDEKMSEASSTLDRTDNNPQQRQPAVVHDLSNVVRSRKHPEQASSPKRPGATTANQDNNNNNTAALSSPGGVAAVSASSNPQQRLLCTLSAHTGSSVLAVRFSNTGKLLASAGDDGCVCLYAPNASSAAAAADNSNNSNNSMWHRILLCRGHNLDAVGLAWSPDDSYLVSVSLDRETPILVWQVADVVASGHAPTVGGMIRSPFKVLGRTEHTSTVKGVCFDPVGSYICTSGDDPAVCIWRTHGDWGLEKRIDAKDGIFRQWGSNTGGGVPLSSQSLFRRLSWSTDGMHILTTNATNKNKHVASTISREQWQCAGSACLLGHKQPVVVAQHAPVLLAVTKGQNGNKKDVDDDDDDPDEEPDYATLVALGDKKGFVTIWSTRKSRPLFKLQCSEGRCTVTDMAWGVADNYLLLAVALLDGHVVMLRLGVPNELGPILASGDQAKLFRVRYGIDTNDPSSYGRLMDDMRPKLIETALQMTLEEENDLDEDMDEDDLAPPPAPVVNQLMGRSKKDGKKRVQPLLVTQHKPTSPPPTKRAKTTKPPPTDALENAKQIADKAAASARATTTTTTVTAPSGAAPVPSPARMPPPPTPFAAVPNTTSVYLSYSTDRVHSVQLAVESGLLSQEEAHWTAECQNRPAQIPLGSKGPGLPCVDISLQRDGTPVWHDQIVGTSCTAMAGNARLFAVGLADGTIQLFGASPVSGWRGENAVRAFPPIVLGHAVVTLQIKSYEGSASLLVVAADGSFGIYRLQPTLAKVLRGSLLPAMTHMANASLQEEKSLPRMSRCQLTDKDQILLLLSSSGTSNSSAAIAAEPRGRSSSHGIEASHSSTVGGSIQGFVYHRDLELWLRISDSRFVLSDFYSSLPLRKSAREQGPLHQLDDAVRLGAMESAIKSSHRKRQDHSSALSIMFSAATDGGNFVPTKAHCEDRLACAIALKSSSEFRQWLGLYTRTLAASGQETLLRTLIDALLGTSDDGGWWLCTGLDSMKLDRKELLKKVVMPAMSKNRALQRLTNELAVELDS